MDEGDAIEAIVGSFVFLHIYTSSQVALIDAWIILSQSDVSMQFLDLKVIGVPPIGCRCEKIFVFPQSFLQKTTLILDVAKKLKSVPFIDLNGYLIFLNNFGHKNPVAEKHSFVF